MNDSLLTPIVVNEHERPAIFPSPFAYHPHPWAVQAARMLQQRLQTERREDGRGLLTCSHGKMFGVLVVETANGEAAFLSAFSGMMSGQWDAPGFVPPLCDQTILDSSRPDGSEVLAELTRQLQVLEESDQRTTLNEIVSTLEQQRQQAMMAMKGRHQQAKEQRQQERARLQQLNDPELLEHGMAVLASTSKRHDQEAVAAKRYWRKKIKQAEQQLDQYEQQIRQLKALRRETSRQLHQRLFEAYRLHNFRGESKALREFFADGFPPAGSGDCAAPKLIHYACTHQLHPVALAEFWWGESPRTGIRRHGFFYPACRGKCRPILPFMLRGLEVETEPSHFECIADDEPQLVYEDEHLLLINKPAGLLSVPGRHYEDSVFSRLMQRYPDCPELRLVHRLDMDTSGLLLVAKNLRINALLQKQFLTRKVEKRYEALLDGLLPAALDGGEINLPLRVDLDDRPRQMVCYTHGKQALTRWHRIASKGEYTRVFFYPETGRTHQLRAHASHCDGLNTPIVGDVLYGREDTRMMLHAQLLRFTHPMTEQRMTFEAPTPF